MQRFRRTFGILTLSALAVSSLAGCSLVDELAHKQKSEEYASASAFETESDLDAAWVPSDATDIRIVRSTTADDASVLLLSPSELDAEDCFEVPRASAPAYSIEGSPEVYGQDEVFACGTWSVVAAEGGWFGWTPNHPDERTVPVSQ